MARIDEVVQGIFALEQERKSLWPANCPAHEDRLREIRRELAELHGEHAALRIYATPPNTQTGKGEG